jgi:hypothetical protein
VVFGVVTLGSMPFYLLTVPSVSTPGCHPAGQGVLSCAVRGGVAPLGGAFDPQMAASTLGRWATVYWALAVAAGFAVVVGYYRRRARAAGLQSRVWPAVAVGVGLLGLVVAVDRHGAYVPPFPDLWIRGTAALLVVALGIAALAVLERSLPFAAFALGFVGLALLSCLYDDVNLLQRVGMAGLFEGSANPLPNLLLPGLYLLVGGLCSWAGGRRARRAALSGDL